MIQDQMDGLVHQDLRATLVFRAGQEYQDLLGNLDAKVPLVPVDILGMREIWAIRGQADVQET